MVLYFDLFGGSLKDQHKSLAFYSPCDAPRWYLLKSFKDTYYPQPFATRDGGQDEMQTYKKPRNEEAGEEYFQENKHFEG